MNRSPSPAYRFVTPAQRDQLIGSCLVESATIDQATGELHGIVDGRAIDAAAPGTESKFYWVDGKGRLFAMYGDGALPCGEGVMVGRAKRIVPGPKRLWILGRRDADGTGRLIQLDAATLHILIDREEPQVDDIAPDGKDGVWLLRGYEVTRLDARGQVSKSRLALKRPAAQLAAAGPMVAALAMDGVHLTVLSATNEKGAIDVSVADLLGGDGPAIDLMLSGTGDGFLLSSRRGGQGGEPCFALVDADGNAVLRGDWRDGLGPTWLAAVKGDLITLFRNSGRQELRRFTGFARRGGRRWLTPALETERPEGAWRRAEVTATLPEGATLTFRWAASTDESVRRLVAQVLDDRSRTISARVAEVERLLSWSKAFTYVGTAAEPTPRGAPKAKAKPERFVLPLHEAQGPLLWVDVQLRGNGAVDQPTLEGLIVIHEADSLMDDLPEIYSGKGDGDGAMRRLVGVLEATTQGLDDSILGLAARLDPRQSGGTWLADLAAMLGLPFHDALAEDKRRALVAAAPAILAGRGTQDGLRAMLEALFPDRAVRVVDRTERSIALTLGIGRIPALLAGPSARVPKLNARLILQRTALCPATACDDASIAPPPEVLVVIPATRRERRRYAEAIRAMIGEMLPAGVRLRLRWTVWSGAAGPVPKDMLTTVGAPAFVGLGDRPGLGGGRLGGTSDPRLDGHGASPSEHRII